MPLKVSRSKSNKYVNLQKDPPFAMVESFRNLYTNLNFAVPKRKNGLGRIICVSSALVGEGKTTVSVNLAISCASAGANTILLDCDMRKPSIQHFFPVESHVGMVEYLSGQAELHDVVVNYSRNLDLIAGKKAAPNPLRLIKDERFTGMLEQLAERYEYIIIDTPPLSIVSDALAIAEHTDGIALIARQMVSTHPMLRQVVSDIEFSEVNFLGFVLNAYQAKNADKGYYKKYYYSKYNGKYGAEQ